MSQPPLIYMPETAEEIAAQREHMRREQELLDARLADVPLPAGATTDGWSSVRHDDGDAIRSLLWSVHDSPTSGIGVEVAGSQDEHGVVEQFVAIYADYPQLTADQARELAGALNEAADALDRLAGQ